MKRERECVCESEREAKPQLSPKDLFQTKRSERKARYIKTKGNKKWWVNVKEIKRRKNLQGYAELEACTLGEPRGMGIPCNRIPKVMVEKQMEWYRGGMVGILLLLPSMNMHHGRESSAEISEAISKY